MTHGPDEWILVVPATVTTPERLFVTGLGKGKRVKISIRDRTWLTDQLIKNRDVAEHFQFGSDIDMLYAKGERFKHNPVIRDGDDVADRMVAIRDSLEMADPDWTFDVVSTGDQVVQILRAKDPNAPARSPIEISFTAELQADSDEARGLETGDAFGYTKPLILPGETIKDFKITGPRLVARDDRPDQLEFHPLLDQPDWKPSELVLRNKAGDQLGIYLADSRILTSGSKGFTLQARLGLLLDLTFRCPYEAQPGEVDFASHNFGDSSVQEGFAAADFMVQFALASTLELRVAKLRIAVMDVEGRMAESDLPNGFEDIRAVLDDLRVIEGAAQARFRFPIELGVEERIMIRSLRLLLEGHCVAHPSYTRLAGTLNGVYGPEIEQILNTDPHWMLNTKEPGEITILGQQVVLPTLGMAARVQLEQATIDEIRDAFNRGDAAGTEISFRVLPGDRVRMYLPDRFPTDVPLDITPWEIAGVDQKGLGREGELLGDVGVSD